MSKATYHICLLSLHTKNIRVISLPKKATHRKTTRTIKTTTSILSSGFCKPRLRVEERLGVERVLRMRALVTLPLLAFLAGVSAADEPSTRVKAVVVVFWSVSTCKSNVEFA